MTHEQQEDMTRALASAFWRSASLPYCRALDHWLAAEAMVAEALRAMQAAPDPEAAARGVPVRSLPSPAYPVDYVRDLAQCFWEHSARSSALTLDIWLAAERHVLALCRAVLAGRAALADPFSAEAYWRGIRDHAERLWREHGRPTNRDLETWLKAEAEVLALVAAAGVTDAAPPSTGDGRQRADGSSHGRPLALTMLEEDGDKDAAPWPPPLEAEPGARPSL
jgi:hypothetical protein